MVKGSGFVSRIRCGWVQEISAVFSVFGTTVEGNQPGEAIATLPGNLHALRPYTLITVDEAGDLLPSSICMPAFCPTPGAE